MIKEIFPEGEITFKKRHHTKEFFALTIDEVDKAGESFIGIIKVDEPEAAYFLFFLRGDAYAAGCIKDGKPMPLSIKDLLQHMSTDEGQRTISLYKTDPVFFKGMLVFLQREPSIKASADMINLEGILNQIKAEKSSAFIILKKNERHNFFYLHSGEPKVAHFVDSDSQLQGEGSIAEQMLLYAYPADKTPVDVMVYRDIKTLEASDKSELKPSSVADSLLHKGRETVMPKPAAPPTAKSKDREPLRIRIEITEGPQKGNKFNIPLPCTIGRRDADIRVRDMTVSKKHASLEAEGTKIIFRDLDSTNGSIVNGKDVKEVELSNGDTVQLGNTTLKIYFIASQGAQV